MEATLRGLIEKVIDKGIEPEVIENAFLFFKSFEPLVKSEVDVVFGHVIGTVRMSLQYYTLAMYGRKPTEEEWQDLLAMILRRAQEIKSKITMVAMK
jgi:hypothetical protein